MRSSCPDFERGRPARNRDGTIRRYWWIEPALWTLALAAWCLAIASV